MTHDEAFMQAVLEAPDDDAPRLMYADWLTEQGDPRGEFIRIQIALERLDEFESRRQALELRERELLQGFGQRWTAPLGLEPRDCAFRRGFVERIHLSPSRFRDAAQQVFDATPLQSWRIVRESHRDPNEALAPLALCPLLSRLRGLDLASLHFPGPEEHADLQTFFTAPLGSLRELRTAALGEDALREFTRTPTPTGLRRFDLSGIWRSGNRSTLNWSELGANLCGLLAGWLPLGRLERLSLSESPLLDEHLQVFLDVLDRAPAALTHLDLPGNRLTGDGILRLGASPNASRLVRLNAARNRDIGPEGYEALGASPNLAALRHLDLTETGGGNLGLQALADSPYLVSLSRLYLRGNGIGDGGLQVLADSPLLPRLSILDLRNNQARLDGMRFLAASPSIAGLRLLDLRENGLGGEAVEALLRSPHFTPGTRVLVQGNRVSQKFMETLRREHAGRLVLD